MHDTFRFIQASTNASRHRATKGRFHYSQSQDISNISPQEALKFFPYEIRPQGQSINPRDSGKGARNKGTRSAPRNDREVTQDDDPDDFRDREAPKGKGVRLNILYKLPPSFYGDSPSYDNFEEPPSLAILGVPLSEENFVKRRISQEFTYIIPHLCYGYLVNISSFSTAARPPAQSNATYAAPIDHSPRLPSESGKATQLDTPPSLLGCVFLAPPAERIFSFWFCGSTHTLSQRHRSFAGLMHRYFLISGCIGK